MTKERKIFILALAVLVAALAYVATMLPPVKTEQRIAPLALYPDPIETPCAVATSDFKELTAVVNGQTYSQAHRKTSEALKKRVCEIYPENCKGKAEIDHCVPLALGGSDGLLNLWAEPEVQMWRNQDYGFSTKDKLENYLVRQVKSKKITPKEAQDCIKKDWVACYQKYFGQYVIMGADIIPSYDGDDDIMN